MTENEQSKDIIIKHMRNQTAALFDIVDALQTYMSKMIIDPDERLHFNKFCNEPKKILIGEFMAFTPAERQTISPLGDVR